MQQQQAFVRTFCREFTFPPEAEEALCAALGAVYADENTRAVWQRELTRYEQDETHDLYDGFYALRPVLAALPVPQETTELLFFILCAAHLRQLYARCGYTETMYRDAMNDLKCKLLECHRLRGVWGSCVEHWFCSFFSLERVALGRLQFELRPMPACISPDGRYAFRGGERSVNVHIPSSGPLEPAAVLDSYRQAAAFFADRFAGEAVLLRCHSWLLFPGHRIMLPPGSRIRQFADTFLYMQTDLSADGHDLWRIFGTANTADPAKLPRETGLQRAYADWLQAGKPVGAGLGIRWEPKP